MECDETNILQSSMHKIDVDKTDSADNFQRFIYDLFDKNGILNDLRAYLRGHIVNVLKSAQTGEPPPCQKHFTQRLELVSQALNILIAEYLLQLDFTYTLSVFVSEIPLSNMVFGFAKALFANSSAAPKLKFQEDDVWSVLNYLGVKCDSEHASNIIEMYKSEEQVPLLFCILKCMPMYRKEAVDNSSHDSLTSSANSTNSMEKKSKIHRNMSSYHSCKHYTFCKSCQNRIARLKEKYKERKKDVHKDSNSPNVNPLNVENFMKNINVMEKRIINEMFEQLHSVYEAEVALVRQEEESRVRRTLASHALQLQQRREEMEESLKTKEAELESSAQHKKKFLWGVARALRDQHAHVARALTLLHDQQEVLEQKENHLKTQLSQAEETLRSKGEEIRVQISKELEILEDHLESLRRERDSLNKERSDLERLKLLCESKTRLIEARGEVEKDGLKQHYDVLRDEIAVLKQYIESNKVVPKRLIEASTITEFVEVPSNGNVLNNTSCHERNSRSEAADRDVRPPNQLVNDLKKQKNVNFSQSNLDDMYRELARERSRCSLSSEEEAVHASERENGREGDTIQRLMEENESLKEYARQQRDHISALWCERARVAAVPRPRTAPALLPAANYFSVHRVNPSSSTNTFGWRKGAGEELSLFPAEPPPLLPGEPIPFVGILRDRHTDNRRHLINQWRALKRRSSPLSGINKVRPPIPIHREMGQRGATSPVEQAASVFPAVRIADDPQTNCNLTSTARQTQSNAHQEGTATFTAKAREKSPKTVLKEAKENLRNKNNIKEKAPLQKRDKSPNSMLREAKLRLRKLEIEAEAVEKSYLDFRKRQAEMRQERSLSLLEDNLNTDIIKNSDETSKPSKKLDDNNLTEATIPSKQTDDIHTDFDKYLRDYQTKLNLGETHFKNKNTAIEKAKPIPIAYSEMNYKKDKRKNVDYLDTPLMEFRKLYHAEKDRNLSHPRCNTPVKSDGANRVKEDKIKPNDNINSQHLHEGENATEIKNKNCDEINTGKNINNNTNESTKPKDYASELEAKLELKDNSTADHVLQYMNLEKLRKFKNNKEAELEILKENINKIYNYKSPRSNITAIDETHDETTRANGLEKDIVNSTEKSLDCDKNILKVEVESSCEVNKIKMSESQDGELIIVVQSSVTTKGSDESEEAIGRVPLTVNISPKDRGSQDWEMNRAETPKSRRSESPEKAAKLTRNDVLDAIFHADDNKNVSSIDMHLELSKDNVKETLSIPDEDPYDDYPDDFSADVDNYNSRSEYGNNSPISLPKSENNFWDN